MHQDQRVGLALGVLLVGACAAFFFRNETRPMSNAPRLQHAQELDDRIAERSTRPYLKGIETVEIADRKRSQNSVDPAHSNEEQDAANFGGHDHSSDKFAKSKLPRFHRPNSKSVDNTSEIQELAPITIPVDDQFAGDQAFGNNVAASSSEEIAKPLPAKSAFSKSAGATSGVRTHVVQRGETLSSIAAKTLGSSHRFQELFEANQDQLHDPNDVKLGMTLRIPDGRTESASKPYASSVRRMNENDSPVVQPQAVPVDSFNDAPSPVFETNSLLPPSITQEGPSVLMPPELPNEIQLDPPAELTPSDDVGSGKKFLPARKSPVPGRPAGPQAKNNGHRQASGRKLTQASLESTSGKVAR